jgi:hypothetical protein
VLGDRRAAHRQDVGEFTDSARALGEVFDDGASGAVAERVPSGIRLVSAHER